MAIVFEDSQKVTRRKAPVPKNDRLYYGALYNALEPIVGKNKLKNLKNLATVKKYNKKGGNSDTNGKKDNANYVNVDVAKKRMERMNPNDITQGGQKAYDFYKKTIERARSQEKVSPVEPPKPTSNASLKPSETEIETIKSPNGKITYSVTAENRMINESTEGNKFWDYLEEYGATYVFESFLENPKGKQNWGVLINPEMYAKALREFTQYGKLVNFPARYVYQWMGIIMKNTAILCANTEIAGHSRNFPFEEFEDFLHSYYNDGREIDVNYSHDVRIEITPEEVVKMYDGNINEGVDKYGQTYFPWMSQDDIDRTVQRQDMERSMNKFKQTYGDLYQYIEGYNEEHSKSYSSDRIEIENGKIFWIVDIFEILYQIGITEDWMQMPDGSDAISDFGIDPLLKIFTEYDDDLPPEKVLVLVNKALDVYHQRGDMASIFVQGGSRALSRIAENTKKNKRKVYMTEGQIVNLKYGKYTR